MYWLHQEGKSALNVHLSLSECEAREAPSSWLDSLQQLFNSTTPAISITPLVINVPAEETAPLMPNAFVPFIIFNEAPTITNFQAVVGPNGHVTLSGTVVDDQDLTGGTVSITGNGINLVATVDEDGHFSVATTVNATGDITVAASVSDVFGNVSATAYTIFTPSAQGGGKIEAQTPPPPGGGKVGVGGGAVRNQAPVITTAEAELDEGGVVIIRGTATDDQTPSGYTVTIQGGGIDTVTITDEDGNFSTGFQRATPAEFTVVIKVYDAAGAVSNEYHVTVPGL